MGLIPFGRYRIGFWMADRTSPPELPGDVQARVEGTPVPGGATLVLVAANEEGVPVWSLLVHEPEGASLLLPWGERLVVGLGTLLLFLDEEGHIRGRYRPGDEWVAAWPLPTGLLLIGRKGVHLLDLEAKPSWQWPHEAEAVLYLDADEAQIRLAAITGTDWREVRLDLRTGRELPP